MKQRGPASINGARRVVTALIRAAAAILIAMGAYYLVKRVVFGISSGDIRAAFSVYMGVGEGHEIAIGVASLLVGTTLALLSRQMARWIVVARSNECPLCGYEGITAQMDRCPECGLDGFGVQGAGVGVRPAGSERGSQPGQGTNQGGP